MSGVFLFELLEVGKKQKRKRTRMSRRLKVIDLLLCNAMSSLCMIYS
jgi:hypothetical protein